MEKISVGLQSIYPPDAPATSVVSSLSKSAGEKSLSTPLASIDIISPHSPASEAGLLLGDLVLSIGDLDNNALNNNLTPVAALIASKEDQEVEFRVKRMSQTQPSTYAVHTIKVVPNKRWGGKGLLGCHLKPLKS